MTLKYRTHTLPFQHPLWAAARDLSENDARALLDLARHGDTKARKSLMEGYIKLGLFIVGQYVGSRSTEHIDDMVSEMLLGIAESVDYLVRSTQRIKKEHPHEYVGNAIRFKVAQIGRDRTKELDSSDLAYIIDLLDAGCLKAEIANYLGMEIGVLTEIELINVTGKQPDEICETPDSMSEAYAGRELGAFEQTIDAFLETKLEEQVVDELKRGISKQDAATNLGISVSTINQVLDAIRGKYEKEYSLCRDKSAQPEKSA